MKKLVVSAIALSALAGAYFVRGDRREAPAAAPRVEAPARATCAFSAGDRLAYTLRLKQSTALDLTSAFPGASGSAARLDLDAHGELVMETIANEKDHALVALSFPAMSAIDARSGAPIAIGDVATPMLARVSRSCAFVALGHRRDADPTGARTQQSLARSLEIVLPDDPAQISYERAQRDATGTFTARYGRTRVDGRDRLERRMLGYDRLFAFPEALHAKAATPHARATIALGDGPWIASLEESVTAAFLSDRGPAGSMTVRKELHAIATPAPLGPIDVAAYVFDDLLDAEPVATPAPLPAELAALDAPHAIAKYEELLPTKLSGPGEAIAFLSKYLAAHPEAVARVVDELRGGRFTAERRAPVFAALALSDTREARDALIAIARAPQRGFDALDRSRALAAMAAIPTATPEVTRSLVSLSQSGARGSQAEIATSATFALGAWGARQGAAHPELAAEVRGELTTRLGSDKGKALADVLTATANMGDPALLPKLEPHIKSGDPATRARAASALRNMPARSIEIEVRDWLRTETDRDVRRSLASAAQASAMKSGGPSEILVAAASAALPDETDAVTRASLVRLLGPAARTNAAARDALYAAIGAERDPETLRLLGRYVSATSAM
ncbi:MAG: hypothetical protein KF819_18295 [Labilithrix sp.]|nr:hypothetical protein [Labilithrix sp.]